MKVSMEKYGCKAGVFFEIVVVGKKWENKVSLSQIQLGSKVAGKQLSLAAEGVAEGIQSKCTEFENVTKMRHLFAQKILQVCPECLRNLSIFQNTQMVRNL